MYHSSYRFLGTHNLAVLLKGGVDGGLEDEYKNWEWHDARLTDTGKEQATSARAIMETLTIDVVLVSPLSRTIQTALLAIPPGPKFIAEELVRERCGTHPCDKRRSRQEIRTDFPSIDLSPLQSEEDDYWTEERESMEALIGRANKFLAAIRQRPEQNIAVVTHNDFLKALFFESSLQFSDGSLKKTFGNAEELTLVITWETNNQDNHSIASPTSTSTTASSTN